jgi:predicted nucleic acid-binding protein
MIILDTNVLSEVVKPQPERVVFEWLAAQNYREVYITAITEAEMLHGLMRMPEGKRKTNLRTALDGLFRNEFAGRILPFDEAAAMSYADVVTSRERAGRGGGSFDCQIAAIARVHSAVVATRNIKDFELTGVTLVNPWSAGTAMVS